MKYTPEILFLDDDKRILDMVSEYFEVAEPKVNCSITNNPQEALKILANKSFDIVFSDLKMPEMDGLDFLQKAMQINSSAGYIIVSAYANVNVAVAALKKGAKDVILKPVNLEDLKTKIFDNCKEKHQPKNIDKSKKYSVDSVDYNFGDSKSSDDFNLERYCVVENLFEVFLNKFYNLFYSLDCNLLKEKLLLTKSSLNNTNVKESIEFVHAIKGNVMLYRDIVKNIGGYKQESVKLKKSFQQLLNEIFKKYIGLFSYKNVVLINKHAVASVLLDKLNPVLAAEFLKKILFVACYWADNETSVVLSAGKSKNDCDDFGSIEIESICETKKDGVFMMIKDLCNLDGFYAEVSYENVKNNKSITINLKYKGE